MDGVTLLRRARDAGLAVAAEGDKLVIRGPKRAEPVARLLIEHKPAVMAALTPGTVAARIANPKWWRDLYTERSAHYELGGRRPRAEAERLAYGECIVRWHYLFGARWPTWQCAGCEEPIGGRSALTLSDGARVHFDEKLACVLLCGERWRGDAAAGLRRLGINQPREQED